MNPFTSGQATTPQNAQTWTEMLSSPENRAALLQFGTSMLGTPSSGSLSGQLGNAVASGAAARDRSLAGQAEQADTASKITDREGTLAVAQEANNIRSEGNQIDRYTAQTGRMNANTAAEQLKAYGSGAGMKPGETMRMYLQFAVKAQEAAVANGTDPNQVNIDELWTQATGLPSPRNPGGAGANPNGVAPIGGAKVPSPRHIQVLKQDPSPEAKSEFDAVYGAGAAARVLGG